MPLATSHQPPQPPHPPKPPKPPKPPPAPSSPQPSSSVTHPSARPCLPSPRSCPQVCLKCAQFCLVKAARKTDCALLPCLQIGKSDRHKVILIVCEETILTINTQELVAVATIVSSFVSLLSLDSVLLTCSTGCFGEGGGGGPPACVSLAILSVRGGLVMKQRHNSRSVVQHNIL